MVILAVPLLAAPSDVRGAFDRWGVGADVCGMSVMGVAQKDPLFPPFVNPASGQAGTGWRFSTFYSRRFGMRELEEVAVACSGPWRGIRWSLGAERFGYSLYSEERFVGGLGVPLAPRTRVGTAVRLHRLRIDGYGGAFATGFDLAWSSEPVEGIRVGATWWNLNRPGLGETGSRVPGGLVIGVSSELLDRTTANVEGGRTTDGWGGLGLGVSVGIARGLGLRMGYRRETGEYSLGTSLLLHFVRWDYAFSLHPALEGTHYLSISIAPSGDPSSR